MINLEIHKAFDCEDFTITATVESRHKTTDCQGEAEKLAQLLYDNLPSRTIEILMQNLKELFSGVVNNG